MIGRLGEVERELVAPLGEREAHGVHVVLDPVVLDEADMAPGAVGQRAQARPQDHLGRVDHAVERADDDVGAVLLAQLEDALGLHTIRSDLAEQVEAVQLGGAGAVQVLPFDVGAHHPTLDDLDGRDGQRFFVDVAGAHGDRAGDRATDVGLVHARTGPRDEPVAVEDGCHDDHIGLVRRTDVRVVREEHVARVDARVHGVVVDDVAHDATERRGVHQDVDAGDDGLAVGGHEPAVEVVALGGDGGAGHAADGHRGFVVDGPQAVTQHLEGGRVEAGPAKTGRGRRSKDEEPSSVHSG